MRVKYGETTKAILKGLAELGPMTRSEIQQSVGVDKESIAAIVSRLHKDTPRVGKQIYITGWVYDAEGQRRYPRAIYALGSKPDAKKPKASALENRRRYDRKRHAMFSMNSVFNLGKSRDTLRAERRAAAHA
jgi:DNA-binding Lrp family transcriptional regulator